MQDKAKVKQLKKLERLLKKGVKDLDNEKWSGSKRKYISASKEATKDVKKSIKKFK